MPEPEWKEKLEKINESWRLTRISLRRTQRVINELRNTYPDDPELKKKLDSLQGDVNHLKSWSYDGPTWSALGMFVILGCCMFFMGLKPMLFEIDLEKAERTQKLELEKLPKSINSAKAKVANISSNLQKNKQEIARAGNKVGKQLDRLKKYGRSIQHKLDQAKAKLEEDQGKLKAYSAMTVEEYRDDWQQKRWKRGVRWSWMWGKYIGWLFLCVLFSFTPRFVKERREEKREDRQDRLGRGFLGWVVGGIDAAMSVKPERVVYSDGQGHRHEVVNDATGSTLVLSILLGIFLLGIIVYCLPVLAGLAFLRNIVVPAIY